MKTTAADKRKAAQAKVEKLTAAHERAAIRYTTALAGQAPELPRRKRTLHHAAIAMVEAIRELAKVEAK